MMVNDSKPAWAQGLPDQAYLDYVRALLNVAILGALVLWVLFAVVRDPRAVGRIGRRQVGE